MSTRHPHGGKRPAVRQSISEKELEASIIAALRSLGCHVTKFSQPRATKQTEGIPDLYARHAAWGIRLWLEVKTHRGRVRPAQAAWHEAERAAGGTVVVVRSPSDAVEALRGLGAPIQ